NLHVNQRALHITAAADNRIYDGTNTAAAHLSDDKVPGDAVSESSASALFATKNVGTQTVTVSGITIAGTASGNYTFNTSTTASATITTHSLDISATSANKFYDGTTASTASPTISCLQGTDTITGLSQSYDASNAGNHTLSVNGGYSVNDGNSGHNYAITLHTAPGVISPAGTGASVVSSASPSGFGQSVSFTATVTNTVTSPVPTGSVQFIVDGSNLGSPVSLDGAGHATSQSI